MLLSQSLVGIPCGGGAADSSSGTGGGGGRWRDGSRIGGPGPGREVDINSMEVDGGTAPKQMMVKPAVDHNAKVLREHCRCRILTTDSHFFWFESEWMGDRSRTFDRWSGNDRNRMVAIKTGLYDPEWDKYLGLFSYVCLCMEGIPDGATQEGLIREVETQVDGADTIGVHFLLEFDKDDNWLGYQGMGYVQFRYPEDAERALDRFYLERGNRRCFFRRSDREFDIRLLLDENGGMDNWVVKAHQPRINLRGSCGDYRIIHHPSGGWGATPRDWDENRDISWDDHWRMVLRRREDNKQRREAGLDHRFRRDATVDQRHKDRRSQSVVRMKTESGG